MMEILSDSIAVMFTVARLIRKWRSAYAKLNASAEYVETDACSAAMLLPVHISLT